jgi:hypothetical protein
MNMDDHYISEWSSAGLCRKEIEQSPSEDGKLRLMVKY